MSDMVTIDYLYCANWSLWLDAKILARTIPYVLSRRSPEHRAGGSAELAARPSRGKTRQVRRVAVGGAAIEVVRGSRPDVRRSRPPADPPLATMPMTGRPDRRAGRAGVPRRGRGCC